MNISIELYRNRIGKFDLSGRNSQYKISRKYDERKKVWRIFLSHQIILNDINN